LYFNYLISSVPFRRDSKPLQRDTTEAKGTVGTTNLTLFLKNSRVLKTYSLKSCSRYSMIVLSAFPFEAAKSAKKGKADKTIIEYLEQLFSEYVFKTLEFLRKSVKFVVPTVPLASVVSLCKGLESLLNGTEEIR
jgi:hypothetical protein